MKKIGILTMVGAVAFILTGCLLGFTGKAKAESSIEVMELRIFLKDGKIQDVVPIQPKELLESQWTGKKGYTEAYLNDLRGEQIRNSIPVLFQQESPACSYWYLEKTDKGIKKICLF